MAGAGADEEARQARVDETARRLLAARTTEASVSQTPRRTARLCYEEAESLEVAREEYIARRRQVER